MREAVRHVGVKADAARSRSATCSRACARRAEPVGEERLGDRGADTDARVEARERILEDHLDVAAHVAHPALVEREDVVAVEQDRARVRLDQAQDRAAGRRLAAAGFADQRQRLAGLQAEGDVLDRVHAAGGRGRTARARMSKRVTRLRTSRTGRAVAVDGVGPRRRGRQTSPVVAVDDREAHRPAYALPSSRAWARRRAAPGIGMLRRGEDRPRSGPARPPRRRTSRRCGRRSRRPRPCRG